MIELSTSKKTFLGLSPEGRKRWALDCNIQAIQFRENGGSWQDIDPSVEQPDTGGFTIKTAQTPYLGRIGDDSHRRIYPDRTKPNCWIQFEKPFASMPAPTRLNRWFYWDFPNALMGVRFDNASIKFGFRLKNASAPTSITIPFSTQQLTRTNRILYHDGQPVAELKKPFAKDATGEVRDCNVTFGTGEVTISLDTTGLIFPINIDPSLDLQVGASLDDADERESTGAMSTTFIEIKHRSGTEAVDRYWAGHRFTSGSLPSIGDTITVAYAQLYVPSALDDDLNGNWHFEKAASPSQFSAVANDITNRTRTTNSVSDIQDAVGVGWYQTPGLVTPLQEVIGSFSPTALVLIFRPNQNTFKRFDTKSWDSDSALAAKLHIEWTSGGGGTQASEPMGARLIAGKLI